MKIAHLSDIHIRFGSRHDEYRQVFTRLYKDLEDLKPGRIVVTGDLNQQKINMSPSSLALATEFLISLAIIAPTDIIMGNHDLNEQQLNQGDTITPFFDISDKVATLQGTKKKLVHIVPKNNPNGLDLTKKGIYYYPNSGFYEVGDNLVYGVYSIRDGELLTLTKKDKDKKYVALFHGQVYGARGDNGYTLHGDNLIRMEVFNNFDIVMMGDIHEHQVFRDDETAAYAGSLIQQDFGESLDKGYLLWDLETKEFQIKYVLNDYGFAKLSISKGEVPEERLEHIKFSHNKKKTKVYVTWSDYEENYSLEREKQIERFIKDKHGCESVTVIFESTEKEEQDNTDIEDIKNQETFLDVLKEFIQDESFDADEDMVSDIIELAKDIDAELEITENWNEKVKWDILGLEICNLFSMDKKPVYIPWSELQGIIGIFGKNYSGKSNVVKALVWTLYQFILEGGDPHDLVNIYTDSNKAYGKIFLLINGEKYYIKREVITTKKKSGKKENSYPVEYKKLVIVDGKEKWESEVSDKTATERVEVKRMIIEAIGSSDDFTKVSLKSQSGQDSYLTLTQQPKNDLINRFAGLQFFRDRHKHGNDFFKEVKKKQKALGDKLKLEEDIVGVNDRIKAFEKEIAGARTEKKKYDDIVEGIDDDILKSTKKLKKLEEFDGYQYTTEESILADLGSNNKELEEYQKVYTDLLAWTQANFKKELPFDENTTKQTLESDLNINKSNFQIQKDSYVKLEEWLVANHVKIIDPIDGLQEQNEGFIRKISELQTQLPLYKGEQCPTCGNITKTADPVKEGICLTEIKENEQFLLVNNGKISNYNKEIAHNQTYENNESKLKLLKDTLQTLFDSRKILEEKIEQFNKSEGIIAHNEVVEMKNNDCRTCKTNIDLTQNTINKLNENLEKFKKNVGALEFNKSIDEKILTLQNDKKTTQLTSYNINQQIIDKTSELRVERNNLENFEARLEEAVKEERIYKKYSIYLQAVHRDGIPALIIRRKLPIINNKINSILSSIVDFRIDMSINHKGDISEHFYYSEDKSDKLSLASGSGSQKFIASIVIQDALHYISNLIKPSFIIIDEGFGTLDDEHISGIVNILQYLKNKYKNVLVITHKNEVKDFVNNIIEVYKVTDGIPAEILDKNPKAGITKLKLPK